VIMAAPKNPNPGPAALARRELGDATARVRLEASGHLVIRPEKLAEVLARPDNELAAWVRLMASRTP